MSRTSPEANRRHAINLNVAGISQYASFVQSKFSSRLEIPSTVIFVGCTIVVGSLLSYQAALDRLQVIGKTNLSIVESVAYTTLSLFCFGLFLIFAGLTKWIRQKSSERRVRGDAPSFMERLSQMAGDHGSTKVFAIASLSYGLFFGFVSGTIVYQPGAVFSNQYGIMVPSAVPVICCGALGQMPQLVIYLTQQFAIFIVPLNLILLLAESWLVGLNAAIARFTYVNRRFTTNGRWFGGLGALVGLFTACPSCAGFFFLTLTGLSGNVAIALTLSSLQAAFIAIGIPALMVSPILASRRMLGSRACTVADKSVHR